MVSLLKAGELVALMDLTAVAAVTRMDSPPP